MYFRSLSLLFENHFATWAVLKPVLFERCSRCQKFIYMETSVKNLDKIFICHSWKFDRLKIDFFAVLGEPVLPKGGFKGQYQQT